MSASTAQRKSEVATARIATKELISDAERERRRKAVEYGIASVELEGFIYNDVDREHARKFIDGEITLDEFVGKV